MKKMREGNFELTTHYVPLNCTGEIGFATASDKHCLWGMIVNVELRERDGAESFKTKRRAVWARVRHDNCIH